MKRLKDPTGILDVGGKGDNHGDKVIRPAILVHSGPNGEKITFLSADGEISFDDERINKIIAAHNAKINDLAKGYGGIANMPVGAFPPILDLHINEDSVNRIIGRLASLLKFEKRNIPGVGDNCSCIIADVTWLGEETVERVNDGRIYALSIGIDEESNTLEELSAVITPAAPGAMTLKQGNKKITNKEGSIMSTKLAALKAEKMAKLSAIKDALISTKTKLDATQKAMHLTRKKGEITSRLHGLMKSAKLTPAEFKKIDITKMSAQSSEAVDMVFDAFEAREPQVLVGQRGSVDAANFMDIGSQIKKSDMKKLKAETRASIAKMSGKKLAFSKDEEEEDKDHGFGHQMEKRLAEEEKVGKDPHAVEGSEEKHLAHLKKHMSMHHVLKKHLDHGNIEEAKPHQEQMMKHLAEVISVGKDPSAVEGEEDKHLACMKHHLAHHHTLKKHLSEGNIEDAKQHHEMMMKHLGHHLGEYVAPEDEHVKHMEAGDVKSEDYKKSMNDLQTQIDELNTQVARVAGMVTELMDVEKEEGEDLEKEAQSHEGLKNETKQEIQPKKEIQPGKGE